MTLHWDILDEQSREELLSGACMNSRMAKYEWGEMATWMQLSISESLAVRSKGLVKLTS